MVPATTKVAQVARIRELVIMTTMRPLTMNRAATIIAYGCR